MPKRTIEIAGKRVTLDARPDRLDIRDLPYRPPVRSLDSQYPTDKEVSQLLQKYNAAGLILDQESEGACTGFGLAAVINFLLWVQSGYKLTKNNKVSTRMLYHLARFYDEWPGEDYEGSSCRGALKGWHRHGVCLESLWPYRDKSGVHFIRPANGWDGDALLRPLGVYYRIDRNSVVDMQAAILDVGAIYVSANVHDGWDIKKQTGRVTHAKLPVIKSSRTGIGGHAFALVGYNDIGFVVQNSWGPGWAANGFAILPYDDWVANGTDAWVVSLGSPVRRLEQRQFFVRGRSPAAQARAKSGLVDSAIGQAKTSGWSEETAYWHTVVTGNDGHVINRLPQVENESDNVAFVGYEEPLKWFKSNHAIDTWRVAIYAHGGLNSEEDSINRIRVLGPNFIANGIYPVFTTWKSGWNEILGNMLQDGANQLFGGKIVPSRGLGDLLTEASDRTLEVFLRNVLGKSIWSEMKENVARSTNKGRGIDTLADQLKRLADDSNKKLEIHLIGHSAGSFVCGKLLAEFRERGLTAKTCTLYAPACDLNFALDHFKAAIDSKQLARADFRVHVLSDKLELDDTVGPYQKSLLYLVSRALDRWHKTPLLGLVSAFDDSRADDEYWHEDTIDDQVEAWQNFFWGGKVPKGFSRSGGPNPGGNLFVLSASQVNVGPRRIKSSHGCFDNSIDIVGDTLGNILGAKLKQPITDLDY
jgi:pimeloyl-ACP methyl ester carboxylesterase